MNKRKHRGILILITWITLSFHGCYEGFTGADGETLKQYLEPSALAELIRNPREDVWIIDVRPAVAYKEGRIPTARSFPSGAIMSRLSELPKDKYLIVYCETGGRAQAVVEGLIKEGYTRVMNWGGIIRWTGEIEKG